VGIYWLDADAYIQAKNGPYKFARVPKFWVFLSEQLEKGTIKSPQVVYREIADGKDDLANWFKQRRRNGLCIAASEKVQEYYGQIAEYVANNYKPHQAAEFLKGADGWVIAHAMEDKGIVVTQESARSRKNKVKIPTICKVFNVRCMNTYDMLDEFHAKF